MKISKSNLQVEKQSLTQVNSLSRSCILFLLYLSKCNIYFMSLIMMLALNKSSRETIFQRLEDKGKWEKAYQEQVNIENCDGYRDAWTHKSNPLTLTLDEMDQHYNLEVGKYNVEYYMEQLGEVVAVLFPEDLVQEYEATHGQLVDTAVARSNNDVATIVEVNIETNAFANLISASLLPLAEIVTKASVEVIMSTELTHTLLPY